MTAQVKPEVGIGMNLLRAKFEWYKSVYFYLYPISVWFVSEHAVFNFQRATKFLIYFLFFNIIQLNWIELKLKQSVELKKVSIIWDRIRRFGLAIAVESLLLHSRVFQTSCLPTALLVRCPAAVSWPCPRSWLATSGTETCQSAKGFRGKTRVWEHLQP